MSIIDRIKRLLGVASDDRGADADAGGAVTIERERSDADPATEFDDRMPELKSEFENIRDKIDNEIR